MVCNSDSYYWNLKLYLPLSESPCFPDVPYHHLQPLCQIIRTPPSPCCSQCWSHNIHGIFRSQSPSSHIPVTTWLINHQEGQEQLRQNQWGIQCVAFCAWYALPCSSSGTSRDRAYIWEAAQSIKVHTSWLLIVQVSSWIYSLVCLQNLTVVWLQKPPVDNMDECFQSDQFYPEPSEGEALLCLVRACHAESIEGLDEHWQGGPWAWGRKGNFLIAGVLLWWIAVDDHALLVIMLSSIT